jgi:carbamoyl-phosphate synthase large subunit
VTHCNFWSAHSAMALSARCGQQAASYLRQRCVTEARSSAGIARAFSTRTLPRSVTTTSVQLQQKLPSAWKSQQLRLFSSCLHRLAAQSQTAPSAQAYLASGAIKGTSDLVDVKKVLVIGSGGLSIGQAGEFDYSGMATRRFLSETVISRLIHQHLFSLFDRLMSGEYRLSSSQSSQGSRC